MPPAEFSNRSSISTVRYIPKPLKKSWPSSKVNAKKIEKNAILVNELKKGNREGNNNPIGTNKNKLPNRFRKNMLVASGDSNCLYELRVLTTGI